MIAISRGADGLSWFWYPSICWCDNGYESIKMMRYSGFQQNGPDRTCYYWYGMLNGFDNSDLRYPPLTKREFNSYGQGNNKTSRLNLKVIKHPV